MEGMWVQETTMTIETREEHFYYLSVNNRMFRPVNWAEHSEANFEHLYYPFSDYGTCEPEQRLEPFEVRDALRIEWLAITSKWGHYPYDMEATTRCCAEHLLSWLARNFPVETYNAYFLAYIGTESSNRITDYLRLWKALEQKYSRLFEYGIPVTPDVRFEVKDGVYYGGIAKIPREKWADCFGNGVRFFLTRRNIHQEEDVRDMFNWSFTDKYKPVWSQDANIWSIGKSICPNGDIVVRSRNNAEFGEFAYDCLYCGSAT